MATEETETETPVWSVFPRQRFKHKCGGALLILLTSGLLWPALGEYLPPEVVESSVFKGAVMAGYAAITGLAIVLFLTIPIRLFCPHCGKYISSHMEWVCGRACETVNGRTWFEKVFYTFLNRCKRCKQPPKTLQCPHAHCQALLPLGNTDTEDYHPAQKFLPGAPEETDEEVLARLRKERERRQEEIQVTKLNRELAKEKAQLTKEQGTRERTTEERAQQDLEKKLGWQTAVHRVANREKDKLKKELNGDPALKRRLRNAVDHWVEDQSL